MSKVRRIKNFKIAAPLFVFAIIITKTIFSFPQFFAQFNLFALLATLIVLIWYTYDTHRIANQTVEGSLRPLILRSGFIESWDDIKFSIEKGALEGNPIEFSILKNIAKDISGHIVINGKKYQLIFANNISGKDLKDEISDLEKSILVYLYDHYKVDRKNSPQKIVTVYDNFDVKKGEYIGVVSSSRYIKKEDDSFVLTDDGIRLMDSDKPMGYRFLPEWGWMNAGTKINAIFISDKYEETKDDNQISLSYSDMEGNRYFTRENKFFSQDSGKL